MQEGLINKITSDFESYMNNDLDVKSAFDYLAETIMKLHAIRTSLSSKEHKKLVDMPWKKLIVCCNASFSDVKLDRQQTLLS